MDFGVWAIATAISFALAILAVKDRTMGIAGIMVMFVITAIAGNDNSIVMTRGFDSSGNPLSQTIAFQPTFLVLGFAIIVSEAVMLFALTDYISRQEERESRMLEYAFE